ncbi:transaldolase family protein [Nocardia wallacei]|uniref:transaldolase family protein n=1 Tax=Nocardia wallacei TaxID=480035 RepID=UPI002453BD80|nr:transaldolase family protein [Nocardia wallacei]
MWPKPRVLRYRGERRAYDDTRYVIDLVASGTVNTMPEVTLAVVADHGIVRGDTITGNYDDARTVFEQLAATGIDIDDVTTLLEREGLAAFTDSWQALLTDIGHLTRTRR